MNLVVQEEHIVQANRFAMAYLQNDKEALSFFHYSPFERSVFHSRQAELIKRSFPREELAQVIRENHKAWGALSAEQEEHLKRLGAKESMVIIGGQQAGLLLGPLYTIYKAITIIQAARKQEELLGKPVVPIFWIAGEDHDFQEINHVYLPRQDSPLFDKYNIESKEKGKLATSQRHLEKDKVTEWLEQFFAHLPKTEFTQSLLQEVEQSLELSQTYVDFFARLMNNLFAKHGLLLINSDNKLLRKLESKVFIQIIRNYELIFDLVGKSIKQMEKLKFPPQVSIGDNPALLFIYENKERLLLEKKGELFQTKDGHYTYTEEALLQIAEETPWRLSNNVITRPFMQESLFPTLAFVGGPGEIAYWALYKDYFEEFGMKLPIVLPRISITLLERPIAAILDRRNITLQEIFDNFSSYRERWLKEQDSVGLVETFRQVREEVSKIYHPLLEKIELIEPGLKQLGEKNKVKVMEQIEYLEKRSAAAQKKQHEAALRQFDKLEQALIPQGAWQERIYTPFIMLNKHGTTLVDQLLNHPFEINGQHKFIYL